MTNDTDSFVQEVDESLRQDRVLGFFKKWGWWLLGAVVLIVAGVAGWQGWRAYQMEAARDHAEEYAEAQELARAGNLDEARAAFERLGEEGPSYYRVMARLEYAAVLEAQGDVQGALAGFDAVAEDTNDPITRETAQLRAAYLAADTENFEAIQRRLQPLIDSESRLSFLARELLAIEAWEAGQIDIARDQLENLTLAFDAPEALRQRAEIALAVIGPAPSTPADGAQAPAPSEGETK